MNLAKQIQDYLPRDILELIRNISLYASGLGYRLYLVGGVVRDLLLGYPNFDLDLVVEGDALILAQQVAETTEARLVTHPRFGTAKLKHRDFTLDVASARREIYSRPGALPTVSPGTIEDDLFRRDFSINAMAISLLPTDYGELIDPYHGRADLERHVIRILHPRSFIDDATRILRAIRYEQRLRFRLETQTAQLLQRDIPFLDTISGDRIRHELELIFRENQPELVINRLAELGVLAKICPSLKINDWIMEKFQLARKLNSRAELPIFYFCLLAYHLDPENNERLILRLNTPARLSRAMRDTLQLKSKLYLLEDTSLKPSDIYDLLHKYDPAAVQVNVLALESSLARSRLELFLNTLRYVKVSLDGEQLQKLGIPPGPKIGKILQILHKAKLNGEVSTKADEEKLVLSLKAHDFPDMT
jgi:tRNA nucleotidyltransferase (CCA-adding enzyme)